MTASWNAGRRTQIVGLKVRCSTAELGGPSELPPLNLTGNASDVHLSPSLLRCLEGICAADCILTGWQSLRRVKSPTYFEEVVRFFNVQHVGARLPVHGFDSVVAKRKWMNFQYGVDNYSGLLLVSLGHFHPHVFEFVW